MLEGPFDEMPTHDPPGRHGGVPGTVSSQGRWGQTRDGKWRAFYSNIGPGHRFCVEHPDDPNFWTVDGAEHQYDRWACRHGFFEGHCPRAAHDSAYCGPEPQTIQVTDEEVEETGKKLAALLSSMESK